LDTHIKRRLKPQLSLQLSFLLQLLQILVMLLGANLVLADGVRLDATILAIDSQLLGDLTHSCDCPRVRLGCPASPILTMLFCNIDVPVIEITRQVAAGAASLTRNRIARLEHDDIVPASDQLEGNVGAGNAAPYDAHMSGKLLIESWEGGDLVIGLFEGPDRVG
jgi:hypothetical protein